MPYTRIATCCYCGTTASLPKKPVPGRIGCSSCGAPLRRIGRAAPDTRIPKTPAVKRQTTPAVPASPAPRRPARRRESLVSRLWDRLEDVIEDVVDDILD